MQILNPGKNKDDRTLIDSVISSGKDAEILRILREQTPLIVIKVRLESEKRGIEAKVRMQARANEALGIDETEKGDLLNGDSDNT